MNTKDALPLLFNLCSQMRSVVAECDQPVRVVFSGWLDDFETQLEFFYYRRGYQPNREKSVNLQEIADSKMRAESRRLIAEAKARGDLQSAAKDAQ